MFKYDSWMSYTWVWNQGIHQIDPLTIVPDPEGGTTPLYKLLGMTRQQALEISNPWRLLQIRRERDRRIQETDWWVLPDRTPTREQLDYRQKLRDITQQEDLDNIVWPTPPN